MKVDSKAVQKALKQIPKKQRSYLLKAVRKSQQEAERLMKTMAPSGRFAKMISHAGRAHPVWHSRICRGSTK